MSLGVGLAVAAGGKTLGVDVSRGSVLYLALEDVPRRLQSRIRHMLPDGAAAPELLLLHTQWPRMGDGGLRALRRELTQNPDTRLVIIDTLKMIRQVAKGKDQQLYDRDYQDIAMLKSVADEFGIAILVVHHLRKSDSDDIMDTVSGSFGLTGAADGMIVLDRRTGQADAVLHVNGRDVEPCEYALRFDGATLSWQMLGRAEEVKSTGMIQAIFDAIKNADEPISPRELSDITVFSCQYVKNTLPKLLKNGSIKKLKFPTFSVLLCKVINIVAVKISAAAEIFIVEGRNCFYQ